MSNCCTECFLDEFLKERIKEEGVLGDCNFCGSKNVHIIVPKELQYYFDPLINLYTAQVEFYPTHLLREGEGRFIWQILSEDWEVFDDWEVGHKIIEEMYEENFEDPPLFLENYVDIEAEWYGHDQDFSDNLKKQWDEFCEEIAHRNRFFPQKKFDNELLIEILTFLESIIAPGESLFRARSTRDRKKLPPEEMRKPPTERTTEGRANPQGISYLYLASNSDTAISEKRPQLKDSITVGEFKVNDEINVVDLSQPQIGTPFKWGDKLEFVLKIQGFLIMLGFILSKPVDRNKTSLEYLPTQYLCEFIKDQDFHGVLYNSFLGDGYNVVLFDETKVECVCTKLHVVISIKTESKELP